MIMILHSYGPGRTMASLHAEVPRDRDIEDSHEVIDQAEREVSRKLGVFLVIHMDPVEMKDDGKCWNAVSNWQIICGR